MSKLFCILLSCMVLLARMESHAQTTVRGKIIDASTKEPVAGASIKCSKANCTCGCLTNEAGEFELKCTDCKDLSVTSVGYLSQPIPIISEAQVIALQGRITQLQEFVLSANRGEGAKRYEAPVAISTITSRTIQSTKPTRADEVLNKISGVNMVSLGNEQHQMSIRQPMTTKGLFLYLQDGIPIRTTGLYNHNALLEMNMAATKSIEVIKGPASSLYGSEAIGGVVNFISAAPTAVPVLKLSVQGNNIGYRRADLVSSISSGKWGFLLSGYYAARSNGYLEYSDFQKGTFTARIDYRFSDKTNLTNSFTYLDYQSDMSGTIDSLMFANHSFSNRHSFTYRNVNAIRYHSTLTHRWNATSKSTFTALFRDNTIDQNPAYRVKDDYRRVNGVFTGRKDLAHGEENSNGFSSFAFIAQHRQQLDWKKAVLIGGFNLDLSPSDFRANYIRIMKDSTSGKYTGYESTDSTLSDYSTKLNNYAAFLNFEFNPLEKLRVVASLRYDLFHYNFDNHLPSSSFSGSPDMKNDFMRMSPKVGFTYNFTTRTGFYANYSEGFVPPQVSELYTGVKTPTLEPAVFRNYEIGGWIEIKKDKLSMDASAYSLAGTNEIISVKLDDGSFENQNTGRTMHRGIEFGINATPVKPISLRLSGAYSNHKFIDFVEKGISYSGKEMNNAPRWITNAEAWYRPEFLQGLRLGIEWQHIGSYFVDPLNTAKYEGYDVFNLRVGYDHKGFGIWLNVMNLTDRYYSYITSKSAFGYSYQPGEPINFNIGISYDLAELIKKKK